MKNFRVTVNGISYDVSVEELDGALPLTPPVSAPLPVKSAVPAPPPAPTAPPAPAAPAANANAYKLCAPMSGTIADIKVAVGDTVSKDQLGLILEAMKMENEIFIPVSGKVTSICITKGASVNAGDVLLTVE